MIGETDDEASASTSPFTLPSARLLAAFTAFYDKATFNKDGSITVIFKLPAEERAAVVDLADNDGMALNVKVWETTMPEGMEALARAVGLAE